MSAVFFEIHCDECQAPVRGNCCVTDDPDQDERVALLIIEQLNEGNVWAWCDVAVTASITVDGEVFTGTDTLGQCSYKGEEDFKAGGYYEDMCAEAVHALKENLQDAVRVGNLAADLLREEPWKTVTSKTSGTNGTSPSP